VKPLTLYDFLRVGHVKRWHNVNTIRDQTVAEHSFMVTLIALELYRSTGLMEKEGDAERLCRVALESIFHDMPEVVMGDMPTPAKRFMRDFTGNARIFADMEEALMPTLPFLGGRVDPSLARFVNMADKIEAAHWISENGAGKHAQIVAAATWRNVEDLVEKYDEEDPGADWYTAVNEVLMALGMRYVHKQSRITPP
jgi:5'-deoxynucleotidase